MRRVRRRRGSRRIAKGKKDWIVGPWELDVDQPNGQSGTQFYTLIDGAELEEKDDRLTVLRIVGDIWSIPTHPTTRNAMGGGMYWHGIKVFETDNSGAILPQFPSDAIDADASWLYLRQGYQCWIPFDFGGGQIAQGAAESLHGYSNSGWGGSHIDVQVKRRLEANEVLLLAMGGNAPLLPWDSNVSPASYAWAHGVFVRTLVGNL